MVPLQTALIVIEYVNRLIFPQITFDSRCHSGKMKITLDIDAISSACKNWKISGTGTGRNITDTISAD